MDTPVIIKVDNVSKVFKLPKEKNSSLKSAFINFYRKNKGFELQRALSKASLEVHQGEFFGIVGRNGSGKSTMLRLLAGIYSPTSGQVSVHGSLTPFIELGVGFNPELTGRENVYLNGALLGFNRKDMRTMYKDIVEFAELSRFMDQKLKNYSSGMQVRLAFSIAIRAQSDILLIDEVLAVGDLNFQEKCFRFFEDIKNTGRTVVIVSHDMEAIKRFCDRAALISKGRVEIVGSPELVADIYDKQNANDVKLSDEFRVPKTGAEIKELTVVGPKTKVFDENDEIRVRIVARSNKNIQMKLGLDVMREDGQLVAGVSSEYQLKPQQFVAHKDRVYEFVFAGNQLSSGKFTLDGILYDANTHQPVFFERAMADFRISATSQGWGMLNLRGEWASLEHK